MKLSLNKAVMYLVENSYINPRMLKFNYNKRTISYKGKVIVRNNECLTEKFFEIPLEDGLDFNVDLGSGFINTLELLYEKYYLSEREHSRGVNFVSKESTVSSDVLVLLKNGEAEVSRVRLEVFLYCVIVGALYSWEFGSKWYWVSERYSKLYLYKKWF